MAVLWYRKYLDLRKPEKSDEAEVNAELQLGHEGTTSSGNELQEVTARLVKTLSQHSRTPKSPCLESERLQATSYTTAVENSALLPVSDDFKAALRAAAEAEALGLPGAAVERCHGDGRQEQELWRYFCVREGQLSRVEIPVCLVADTRYWRSWVT